MISKAWEWKGTVDFWINNAGGDVLTGNSAEQSLEDKLKLLWQVDVNSTLMLSRRAGNKMREHSDGAGRHVILNMGWDQAAQGMEGDSGELFATTKGAIMAMTKSLAQSLSPEVRVNCIAPGFIMTDMTEVLPDAVKDAAKQIIPVKRFGQVQDVAKAVAFLASDDSGYITGQVLCVDGGMAM